MLPGDLVTDLDLLALDTQCATDFGGSSLQTKRRVAVEHWLRPQLEQAGYQPWHLRTRRAFELAWGLCAGTYTDLVEAFDDIEGTSPVASLVVTPSSDCLYLGLREPFRGLHVGLEDAVNSTAGVASLTYWAGTWKAFGSLVDDTKVSGLSLAKAGRVDWTVPDDWYPRAVNDEVAYYVRVQVSSPCAPAALTHVSALVTSRLTYPVARYALSLLYAEGSGSSRGRWADKAETWAKLAQAELDRVLPLVRDEFDIDATDTVDRVEASSVVPVGDVFGWERG